MEAKIVLLGPPGAGKGTQAKSLCDELKLTLIATGDLLREGVRNNTPLGQKAKSFMDEGKLVPDELVIGLINEKLKGLKGGFLLDGFPRNLEQAQMLDTVALINLAINLEVDEDIIVERIIKRRSCKKCSAVYHLQNKLPKVAGECDLCGGQLYQRTDDTEKVVRERLKVYKERTLPLVKFYKDRGILVNVKGTGAMEEVHQRLTVAVRGFKK
jgi:adenylate kinase